MIQEMNPGLNFKPDKGSFTSAGQMITWEVSQSTTGVISYTITAAGKTSQGVL